MLIKLENDFVKMRL